MDNSAKEAWELRLQETAAGFVYPPTPDIAGQVKSLLGAPPAQVSKEPLWAYRPVRLAAGTLAVLILLLALTLAIPPVRAAVLEFLQIGAIGIFVDDETPTTEPGPPVIELAGVTTLAQASNEVDFAIRLPTYPADLGAPDQVYLQQLAEADGGDQVVILVWLDPSQPAETLLSLYQIDLPFYGIKQASTNILRETRVAGEPAFWVEGPHQIQLAGGDYQDWFFVAGNVLIWTEGQMTYRLESGLSLEEALRIAESIE